MGKIRFFLALSLVCSSVFFASGALSATAQEPAPASAGTNTAVTPDKPASPDASDTEEKVAAAPAKKSVLAPAKAVSFGDYLSGRFAESQGDTGNGIAFLRDSLKHDPANKDLLASLYRMLLLSGEISDAADVAVKLGDTKVVEDGSEFTPQMLLAIRAAKEEHYTSAREHLKQIHKVGFNSLLVPLFDAWAKLGEGDIKQPIGARDILPDAKVILPHIHLNAGFIDDIAGFPDAAQKEYEAAVKDTRIEPFRAVEALANFYDRKGMTAKREALVKDYLDAHGESFLADEILVESVDGKGSKPLVSNTSEGFAEVLYTMANIFHGVRAPADEVATIHLALYLRPDFPAAQFLLASAYELEQDYHQAIDTYKTISKESPYYVRGRIRSAYDEDEMDNKTEALSELDAISKENPKGIDALIAKGDILRSENHFKEAIEAYDEALKRVGTPQKHHWILYFSIGASYQGLNQWDKAEANMKKALALNPGEPEVLNYLGYSWLTQGRNKAEATKMIEQAYDARPEDAHIIDSMGYAMYVAGDFPSAEEYYEQALERTPNDPTVNDHLGDTFWQMGRKTEARFQWERSLNDNPDETTASGLHLKLEKGLALIPANTAKKKPTQASVPAEGDNE
jgi:tetratricopeptide (TPR) repeat protein